MGPTTPPKRVEFEEFARQIAAFLGKEFGAHHFEALAILAPARFLGLLRANLPPEVQRAVVFEEAKDLVHVQDSELAEQLMSAVDASFREVFARAAIG
jgi:protein required for attachment to host cells